MRLTTNAMTLLTLTTGGLLTQGGALLQRVWGRQDEQRAEERRRLAQRDDERQARVDRACEAILEDAERIRVLASESKSDALDPSVRPLVQRIARHSVYVPDAGARGRIYAAAGMVQWAGPIAKEVPYGAAQIAWMSAGRMFIIAGALLRREDPGPEPDWYGHCLPVYRKLASIKRLGENVPDAD